MNIRQWIQNPKYVKDRIKLAVRQLIHKNLPWLTYDCIKFLDSYLRTSDNGLEWGSGRSTIWLAKRTKSLISIETNNKWYQRVNSERLKENLTNVSIRLTVSEPYTLYLSQCQDIPDSSLDFVLVDGEHRHLVAQACTTKLKEGGLLIIDNINWYLPSPFGLAPGSVKGIENQWLLVNNILKDWRCFWTTDGVTETAIWFKPHMDPAPKYN
jgi:hypothetical protein